MNATKRAQVPFGLRKKLMAATSMLLVAAIMLVSTSYAWFTLSTAPEITGISTSVGANGNLEIALLTTETFANTDLITSNTGDSMDAEGKSLSVANATWGNLVDLTDTEGVYGMNSITLYPAKVNYAQGDEDKLGTAPLGTPLYGADGRVVKIETNRTTTAIYDKTKNIFPIADESYGVRAVGSSSNVSARAIMLKTAKGVYASKASAISTHIRNAVQENILPFLSLAATGGAPETYTYDQVKAMYTIATGVETSLNNIVNAYANMAIAYAAADTTLDDTALGVLQTDIGNLIKASDLQGKLNEKTITTYDSELGALANLQSSTATAVNGLYALLYNADGEPVADANTTFGDNDDKTTINNAIKTLLGENLDLEDSNGDTVTSDKALSSGALYLVGGVVNNVAQYSGTFHLTTQANIPVYAGAADYPNGEDDVDKRLLPNALNDVTASGESTGASNITDFYGYIIDFAFRTNAANSNLQLQTAPENRVYSNADDPTLATQGGGSTATFEYNSDALSSTQAAKLMDAVRIVFFNPDDMTIYATAKITNVNAGTSSATGEIYLIDAANSTTAYELGKDAYTEQTAITGYKLKDEHAEKTTWGNYAAELTVEAWEAITTGETNADTTTLGKDAFDPVTEVTGYTIKSGDNLKYGDTVITTDQCTNYVTAEISVATYETLKSKTVQTTNTSVMEDESVITSLSQNVVLKMSALVYLDGENIDNSAVANGQNSGSLKLNLQFSSSAELTPMENSALKNMEKTNS